MLYIGKERISTSADNSGMKWNLLNRTADFKNAISPSDAITADYGDYMLVEGDTPAEWNYSLKDFRNLAGGINSSLIYSYTPEMEVA